jgi:Domain of unknown function (DUF4410)
MLRVGEEFMTKIMGRMLGLMAGGLLLAGCASISIVPGTNVATDRMPKKVYVAAFGTDKGEFKVDRDGAELKEFKSNLQLMMSTAISVDLSHRLIAAKATSRTRPWHEERAWLICGQFRKVKQGSRLLRGVIGFGAGGTKLITRVQVYDLSSDSDKPFLTFSTSGGSNAEPGAVTAIATDPLTIAIEAVAGGFGGVAHGLTEDTKRSAREITAELSDYMFVRGWIPQDKWIPPKKASDNTEW